MSQISNNDKLKDKKKPFEKFVERIFHFATVRINKKSEEKKKQKKSSLNDVLVIKKDVINISMKILQHDSQTLTYCDYCDKEIIADFTGQNIIYHDFCNEKHGQQLAIESDFDLEKSNELLGSIKSEKLQSPNEGAADTLMKLKSRLSISLNDINLGGMTMSTEYTMLIGSGREQTPEDFSRGNMLLDTESWSYTFSTVDLATIKQFGISIKKVLPEDTDSFTEDLAASVHVASSSYDVNERPRSRSLNIAGLHPDTLKKMMEVFNHNEKGLFVERDCDQIKGKIRVFINLLRPIKMLLTARPPSIFEVSPEGMNFSNQSTIDRAYYNKDVILRLPRGTTTVLYVDVNCPTSDVISLLLSKFNIRNNPKKFALYEHTIKSPKEVEVCKLRPYQCPLKIMMDWCSKGADLFHHNLETKRFVLQENDPGSIEWTEFSEPELNTFTRILNQEEEEMKKQIVSKFEILRKEIFRHMIVKNGDRALTDRL